MYQVYIIDEVHMLSTSAFNALLKTLEEPPAHVIFILATTEIRKVPVTILSRCQRFDLARVSVDTLKKHFAWVAAQENIELSDGANELLARAADGSVRDGMSWEDFIGVEIELPSTIQLIESEAFSRCLSLTKLMIANPHCYIVGKDIFKIHLK